MIKVLIVEDSRVAQEFLTHVLTRDADIQVVGVVSDGAEAVQAVQEMRPDVVTMDIHMPRMNGYDATRAIMQTVPTPIVIVSASTGAKDATATFRALEVGALAVVLRPLGMNHPQHETTCKELIWTLKTMSEIKVVKRYDPRISHHPSPRMQQRGPDEEAPLPTLPRRRRTAKDIQLIAIGASTGGPPVLNTILSNLPSTLSVPILIVQHIAPGFAEGFAAWLGEASKFPVQMAVQGQQLLSGHAYVAPNNLHMGIRAGPRIVFSNGASEYGMKPSVGYLFRSVARIMADQTVGVLLTGMGKDGANELKELRDQGGVTIAQDESTSIVHGMPGEAIKLGGASYILSPKAIASLLTQLAEPTTGGPR